MRIARVAEAIGIRHIQFSGGEPLLHPELDRLLRIVQDNAPNAEVGMATNGKCITTSLAQALAPTMNNIRINLPTLSPKRYRLITGANDLPEILETLDLLVSLHARVGINTVYHSQNLDEIWNLVEWAAIRDVDLKILEWIDPTTGSSPRPLAGLLQEFTRAATQSIALSQSAKRFEIPIDGKIAHVRVILPPCERRLASACKEYGEVRLLPNLHLQMCLLSDQNNIPIDPSDSAQIEAAFEQARELVGRCPN